MAASVTLPYRADGLSDQESLDVFEAHVLEALGAVLRCGAGRDRRAPPSDPAPSARCARSRARARARCRATDAAAARPSRRCRSRVRFFRYRRACCSRKCVASDGMSSRRSRSGGSTISIVLSRNSRSCRKRPAATSASMSALVADRMRTSTRRVRDDPRRSNSPAGDHAQQLGLLRRRHVRDFVEEQRAAVGQLEPSHAIGCARR